MTSCWGRPCRPRVRDTDAPEPLGRGRWAFSNPKSIMTGPPANLNRPGKRGGIKAKQIWDLDHALSRDLTEKLLPLQDQCKLRWQKLVASFKQLEQKALCACTSSNAHFNRFFSTGWFSICWNFIKRDVLLSSWHSETKEPFHKLAETVAELIYGLSRNCGPCLAGPGHPDSSASSFFVKSCK